MWKRRHQWKITGDYVNRRHGRGHKFRCNYCEIITDSAGRYGRHRLPECRRIEPGQQFIWSIIDGTEDWFDQLRALNRRPVEAEFRYTGS